MSLPPKIFNFIVLPPWTNFPNEGLYIHVHTCTEREGGKEEKGERMSWGSLPCQRCSFFGDGCLGTQLRRCGLVTGGAGSNRKGGRWSSRVEHIFDCVSCLTESESHLSDLPDIGPLFCIWLQHVAWREVGGGGRREGWEGGWRGEGEVGWGRWEGGGGREKRGGRREGGGRREEGRGGRESDMACHLQSYIFTHSTSTEEVHDLIGGSVGGVLD